MTDTRPTERDHCPMETGTLVVLLPTAEGRGEYVVTAYTVFADGRLQLHMADGSTVTSSWTTGPTSVGSSNKPISHTLKVSRAPGPQAPLRDGGRRPRDLNPHSERGREHKRADLCDCSPSRRSLPSRDRMTVLVTALPRIYLQDDPIVLPHIIRQEDNYDRVVPPPPAKDRAFIQLSSGA